MLHLPLGKAFQSKKGMLIIHLIVGYSFPRPIGYWRIIMYTIDIGWYRYIYIYIFDTVLSLSLGRSYLCWFPSAFQVGYGVRNASIAGWISPPYQPPVHPVLLREGQPPRRPIARGRAIFATACDFSWKGLCNTVIPTSRCHIRVNISHKVSIIDTS